MEVRVRFAPSPTGYLHVGGARTALFNWLFARANRGAFVLRIEDTDVKRSDQDMVQGILEGLRWLGLDWDEGPYFQSQRLLSYTSAAEGLVRAGQAYRDFSPPDREADSYHEYRDLPLEESDQRATAGDPHAIRFKVPKGRSVRFQDLVFGAIVVETDNIEDFVILRSDGYPTYHLSVVVDDAEMGITHVVRGADHLTNTSKHVLLFEAMGGEVPVFAHLPLILGTDKKRLSKRHGATSVTEYRDQGFLPAAMVNYLALLGWSPGDDSELLNKQELIERFSLERINKANAVFDPAKVDWMNKRYLSILPAEELAPYVERELEKAGLWDEAYTREKAVWFRSVVDLLKGRAAGLSDFPVYGRAFFTDDYPYEEAAVEKYLNLEQSSIENLLGALRELRTRYSSGMVYSLESCESDLREVAGEYGFKPGNFIGAVRVAMTGRGQAPGIFDVLLTLGREKTVERLDRLIRYLVDG